MVWASIYFHVWNLEDKIHFEGVLDKLFEFSLVIK